MPEAIPIKALKSSSVTGGSSGVELQADISKKAAEMLNLDNVCFNMKSPYDLFYGKTVLPKKAAVNRRFSPVIT